MAEKSASEQIDNIVRMHNNWKGKILSQIRAIVLATDSNIFEEVKWKMATRPEGLAVWSRNGIICFLEIWKDNVKLMFVKGAQLSDPHQLFNARLKSKTNRAIEIHEGDNLNEPALKSLVAEAVKLNASKKS